MQFISLSLDLQCDVVIVSLRSKVQDLQQIRELLLAYRHNLLHQVLG